MTLVDDAMEVLADRENPADDGARRLRLAVLHAEHDRAAYAFVDADLAHSGAVTLSARALANLLEQHAAAKVDGGGASSPSALYAAAERRRRRRARGTPAGRLAPDVFDRCLGEARTALHGER